MAWAPWQLVFAGLAVAVLAYALYTVYSLSNALGDYLRRES